MNRQTLSITWMSCNSREQDVQTALKNLGGVTRVDADHVGDTVAVVIDEDVVVEGLYAAIE